MNFITDGKGINTSPNRIRTEISRIKTQMSHAKVICTGYPTILGEKITAPGHLDHDWRKPSEVKKDQDGIAGLHLCNACSAAFQEERRYVHQADNKLTTLCQQVRDVKGYLDAPNIAGYTMTEEQVKLLRAELKGAIEIIYSTVEPTMATQKLAEMGIDVEYAKQLDVNNIPQ